MAGAKIVQGSLIHQPALLDCHVHCTMLSIFVQANNPSCECDHTGDGHADAEFGGSFGQGNHFRRPKTTINGDNLTYIYLPSEHPLGKDGLSENSFKGGDNLLSQAALAGKISHHLSHVLTI